MHALPLLFAALVALFSSVTTAPLAAQSVSPTTTDETASTHDLAPGKTLRDRSGRVVENAATNNGKVKVKYRGKKATLPNGQIEVEEIIEIETPTSGGANNVSINTGNNPTTITLNESDGTATITGGQATIAVGGANNTITVGGTGNNATITGNNNTGSGTAGSGGTVGLTGTTGNSWSSGGGNWTVRT